ncbi:MAG: hypothetical protein GX093_06360 [Xanthomonadaceae bacterium]|nr:hypothetical protein [Xanthomonadaceae bacterium]
MRGLLMLVLLGLGVSGLVGCEQEGPLERAGERADRAAEDTGRAIDDATER